SRHSSSVISRISMAPPENFSCSRFKNCPSVPGKRNLLSVPSLNHSTVRNDGAVQRSSHFASGELGRTEHCAIFPIGGVKVRTFGSRYWPLLPIISTSYRIALSTRGMLVASMKLYTECDGRSKI